MNNLQKEIHKQIKKEQAEDVPNASRVKNLARKMVDAEDNDIQFTCKSDPPPYKEVKRGARCYKYMKWYD